MKRYVLLALVSCLSAGLMAEVDLSKVKEATTEEDMMAAFKDIWQPFIDTMQDKSYDDIFQLINSENPPKEFNEIIDAVKEYGETLTDDEEKEEMLYTTAVSSLFALMPEPEFTLMSPSIEEEPEKAPEKDPEQKDTEKEDKEIEKESKKLEDDIDKELGKGSQDKDDKDTGSSSSDDKEGDKGSGDSDKEDKGSGDGSKDDKKEDKEKEE